MDGAELRAVLLRVVDELSRQDRGSLQAGVVLQQAARHLGLHRRGIEDQQALLAFFYDLFRTGYLSWGMDLANQAPPFCHVTALGRQALAHHSRDPANPDGYLAYLASRASIGHVTRSYVSEALQTFNAACFKATAVLIGAAAESVIMEVRDALTARLTALGRSGSQDLRHRLIKRVLAGIRNEILSQKRSSGFRVGRSHILWLTLWFRSPVFPGSRSSLRFDRMSCRADGWGRQLRFAA